MITLGMDSIIAGIAVILFGGILNGTFAVFLKYKNPWKWENFWLVYSTVAMVIVPFIWAWLVTPRFLEFLSALHFDSILYPMIFGTLWGIGSVLFGLSVERIGMGLSFTIIVGIATLIGTVTPLFLHNSFPSLAVFSVLIIGLAVIIAGITISGLAGLLREKSLGIESQSDFSRSYFYGLMIAGLSGIFSSMLNIGFAYGKGIGEIAKSFGAADANATLSIFVIVLFGGFIINAGYATFLLLKNKSANLYRNFKIAPWVGSVAAGLFWFGGNGGLYGIGTAYLGKLGTSVGFAVLLASSIIVGNFLGVFSGEWKKTNRALRLQLLSVFILAAGIAVISGALFVKS